MSKASIEQPANRKPQFSIRALMIAALVVACWLGLLRVVPHIAVFLSGVALLGLSAWWAVRAHLGKRSRLNCWASYLFAAVAWFYFYVVSVGPAVVLSEKLDIDNDIMEAIYKPVIWLHAETPLKQPLEDYVDAWDQR